MQLDPALVDAALTTTRAVRRRLDFDRDVADALLLDCIDVAEQAPTGGNLGSRRWLIIRDQATKDRLGELYRDAGGDWVIETAERLAGTGHPNERMMQGAAHLARNLSRAPVLVIPTILGRHDGSGRPGLFDSVIQAAWSFMVALRARGLGTTWTTMYLNRADDVAELLGIPEDVTQICLLPVAYTIGTDFSPSRRRLPAREIAYFDRYAMTIAGERSEPLRLGDGPGVVVEVDIDAPPDRVWALVSDLDVPGRFSEEYVRGEWQGPPGQGAEFVGHNQRDDIGEWQVPCTVVAWDPPARFAWHTSDPDQPGARWRYDLEPIPGGTRLRHLVTLGPGRSGLTWAIRADPANEAAIIADRQHTLRRSMQATVEGIKALAEQAG